MATFAANGLLGSLSLVKDDPKSSSSVPTFLLNGLLGESSFAALPSDAEPFDALLVNNQQSGHNLLGKYAEYIWHKAYIKDPSKY